MANLDSQEKMASLELLAPLEKEARLAVEFVIGVLWCGSIYFIVLNFRVKGDFQANEVFQVHQETLVREDYQGRLVLMEPRGRLAPKAKEDCREVPAL